jgi:anaerobic nitric oxide reductase flavorubredoxin
MATEIAENVYWVGAVDWQVRHFHGYTYHVQRGTTYNAYLVVDDQVALIDTVMPDFSGELLRQIGEVIDPSRIDLLVANHGEVDHAGSIPAVLDRAPGAQLVCSKRGVDSLGKYFGEELSFHTVGTGDTISLGNKTLTFLEAPMLHWPDSMFTYIPEDRLLLPNDAFGQHLATPQRFADQVNPAILWEEARRYYANILTPFSRLVVRKVEQVQEMGIEIDTIAPSHGVIWRQDPAQIVEQYVRWAKGEAHARALVVYETMWGSTAEMAWAILQGLVEAGIDGQIMPVPQTDNTAIVGELLEAKGILIGSPTHNRRPLLNISALVEDLIGLRPVNKIGAAFGAHGWGGGGVPLLEERMQEAGIEVVQPGFSVKWRAAPEELALARDFGRAFGKQVKERLA